MSTALIAIYDRLQAEAQGKGQCPKILTGGGSNLGHLRACGRPAVYGPWCERHRWG